VRSIQERYKRYRESIKNHLTNRLTLEQEKYALSKENQIRKIKLEEEFRRAKEFKKYQGFVSLIFFNLYLLH
jgi:hypothetical protein